MNRTAQALVLTAIGALALRVGLTDEYIRYVNDWMRWPLVASGVFLVALAFTAVLRPSAEEHRTTRAAWALLIPITIGLVVQPPALGSYLAERGANRPAGEFDESAAAPLREGETADLQVSNLVTLASYRPEMIEGHTLRLRGFVTTAGDDWYVTRLAIRCCAADAAAYRVQVDGQVAPPKDQWVEVVGTWVEGTGTTQQPSDVPVLAATGVTAIDEPRHPYE